MKGELLVNSISNVFKALSDPTRLRMVNLLAQRGPGICVCDLVDVLQVPQSTISRQMAPLKALNLVRARRAGTWMLYALEEREDDFYTGLRACLKAALEQSEELRADLERFDLLKQRRELASCCQPMLLAAAQEDASGGTDACCSGEVGTCSSNTA